MPPLTTSSKKRVCPLCSGPSEPFFQDKARQYLLCDGCALVWVPHEFFLCEQEEKRNYDLHENSPHDAGYRRFLRRVAEPLCKRLKPGSHGLDFGSGPGPTLSVMLEQAGHHVTLYDPFYCPDEEALSRQYDFVTATEVLEHLREPRLELDRLWSTLRPGGALAVMTQLRTSKAAFATWGYIRDRTHLCFYSERTMRFLAARWSAELAIVDGGTVLFCKG